MKNIFKEIIKISIYLLVFLLPLFWLPFTFEFFEFNKQFLLFLLVTLAFWAWLAKMIISDREIRFRQTPLDLPILIFLAMAIISAIFSVDKTSSLFGFYGRFSDGLISLLCFGALYFLITNNVSLRPLASDEKEITLEKILKVFFWSCFFVIFFSYFSLLGIFQKIFGPGNIFGQKIFNPVAGSLEGLAVFLSCLVILLIGLIIGKKAGEISKLEVKGSKRVSQKKKARFGSFPLWFLFLASLGLLVIINFSVSWWILLLGFCFLVGLSVAKRIFRENVNRLLLPIFLIIVAVAFLAFPPLRNFQPISYSQELLLRQKISWEIGINSVFSGLKNSLFGSGIGTYFYDFARFKPARFNQSLFWMIRFDRPSNHFAEIFGTMGFLGILSYLFLIWVFWKNSWQRLKERIKAREVLGSSLALFFSLSALFLAQFFYYQNTVLGFFFWFALGLSALFWSQREPKLTKSFSFKDFPELSLVFSVILIILGLAIAGMYYWAGRFYLADSYSRAPLRGERVLNLERAVALNPYQAQYKILLARAYLAEISQETQKPAREQDLTKIQLQVSRAIDQGKAATERAANWVACWETLGMVYRDIQAFAQGATDWGIKSFEKAAELEPKNPVFPTELGKLYLAKAENQRARENFEKAISLKEDYIEAHIQLALLAEREGNIKEALAKMEETAKKWPLNTEVLFQLGRLYYNEGRLDEAINQFRSVIALFPNHSNAHYSLGLAYQRKGQIDLAISEFEKVLQLNPDNPDVKAKLEELRGQ